jgi:hypothetical protein
MKFTADELEAVAARLCPDLYKRDPDKAINVAKNCLDANDPEAWEVLGIILRMRLEKHPSAMTTFPIGEARLAGLHCDYDKGVKLITGRLRPDRAKEYFEGFLISKHGPKEAKAMLKGYEEKGFSGTQAAELRQGFAEWWPHHRRKKGDQGRVKNPAQDERTKARPAAIPEMKDAIGTLDEYA